MPPPDDAPNIARELGPLTAKPVLFVANVDEGSELVPSEISRMRSAGRAAVAMSSRIEAELAELDDEDAAAMREEFGVSESGLERVVREAFALLQLLAFFTAGEAKPAHPGTCAGASPHGTPRARSTPTSRRVSYARK